MDPDDPFFSPPADDRTIIRPIPGGKKEDLQRAVQQQNTSFNDNAPLTRLGNLNPLENSASALLTLLTQINNLQFHPDPELLRKKITEEIKTFQQKAQAKNIDNETIFTARYVLCTALDEAVLNTPWGHTGGWAQHSLLSHFHKEVSGGERFFQLLKSLGNSPSKNIDLLELMYLCLSFGFEGRYRLDNDGRDKLIRIREWLYQIIASQRGTQESSLSPHWRGVTDKRNPLLRLIPLWVFAAVMAGVLAIIFTVAVFYLNHRSDPVYSSIVAINPPKAAIPEPRPAPPVVVKKPVLTLSQLLSNEINLNLLQVTETDQMSVVTLQGDGLFRSGSASIHSTITALLYRIGESLSQLEGHILVTGHTDSIPVRGNLRYPSNWALSQARAETVTEILLTKVLTAERLLVEGRGDTEPVAANDSREGRAKNRRVEIMLMK